MRITKFGDWSKAGIALQKLSVSLVPAFRVQLQEDGELFLKTVLSHIERQDLNWSPLSQETIARKGDDTIYVETGFLKNHIKVRKIRAPKDGLTLFIGASPWQRTPEGVKLSDLMIWLEYGTRTIPPRPLIRPSWEEVEPVIKDNWRKLLEELIETGGSV